MTTWSGKNMSQVDFMLKDECILLDVDDNIVGHDNKYETHIFCPERPRAKLHRAFSVFLFNSEGKLLLQQRASCKITFPNVWTNTCCSHPLHGYNPTEVDGVEDLKGGLTPGVKRAAIRKLEHELGISPTQVSVESFKFLTRLHYWAADVGTHGPQSPFGEHEIDYILFIQANVDVHPNPEEVRDFRYVTLDELRDIMQPSSGLAWSPWFRIITERFLVKWWDDLTETLTTDRHVDLENIHRFECAAEYLGGAGNAGQWIKEGLAEAEGDAWLAAVAANGGTAPVSKVMKPFLERSADGKWSLLQTQVGESGDK
mmetsp:Transcript_36327/g.82298  ORF Transcript_36327/g.82298 Transcript_36327/m.82298 type:complete len:314 (-) Transcript_36327:4-945(-)